MRKRKIALAMMLLFTCSTVTVPTGMRALADTTTTTQDINVSIDTNAEKSAISPYIYGNNSNQEFTNAKVETRRLGGNRTTGYNWENNSSNAGADWKNESDNYWLTLYNVPKAQYNQPGSVYTTFHDKSLAEGVPYSLVDIQAAGYVAADQDASTTPGAAPSSRWKKVQFNKPTALSLTPDTTDDTVYMDEFVNYLTNKYGKASSSTGIKGYEMDNEPALWSSNHPLIHPDKATCSEVVDKNTELAKTIKRIDPTAETFGPGLFGFSGYASLNKANDWAGIKNNGKYQWFIDYYLDQMKKNSDTAGKRLMDVFDIHWYPEAKGGGNRIIYGKNDSANIDCNKARMQAPRTLWDPSYTEDSWIGQWNKWALPLVPKVKASIDKYNPGTKLAITEYNYGGQNHISGGIAEADVLGTLGKQGVYMADFWPFTGSLNYIEAAFNLYNNYDNAGSKYGDTNVKCDTSDVANSSTYAATTSKDGSKMDIIVMNKNYDSPMNFNFNINSDKTFTSGKVWGFDSNSSNVTERSAVSTISGNKFTYTIPALTAVHIVLNAKTSIPGDLNSDGKVNLADYILMKKYIMTQNDSGLDLKAADLNNDGKINLADAILLKKALLNK